MATKDRLFRLGTGLHQAIFTATKGRVAGRIGGMPVVLLTTTGRRSGKQRSTMLATPVHDDDKVVLVASFGGDPRHPTWFLNLRDNPDVTLTMEGRQRRMRATVATTEEKAALWPAIVAAYPNYDAYQQKTDRDIPVVVLTPSV